MAEILRWHHFLSLNNFHFQRTHTTHWSQEQLQRPIYNETALRNKLAMASAFIGLSVKVLLTNGTSLKGHVADVDQVTQRLMLQDGKGSYFIATQLQLTHGQ